MDKLDIGAGLTQVRQDYGEKLSDRICELESCVHSFVKAPSEEEYLNSLKKLVHISHKLSGSAGTFGYIEVGNNARILEIHLRDLLKLYEKNKYYEISEEQGEQLAWMTQKIKAAQGVLNNIDWDWTVAGSSSDLSEALTNNVIFMLEDDADFSKIMSDQLTFYGYDVHVFDTIDKIIAHLEKERPSLFVIDVTLDGSENAGFNFIKQLQDIVNTEIPFIVLTRHDSFSFRLKAVRLGASAYIVKPTNTQQLQKAIDGCLVRKDSDQIKALIVDDDQSVASFYKTVLEGANIIVETLHNPDKVIEKLSTYLPDIILSDVYMPECSGFEMVKVIRQHDKYAFIPVIFLSVDYASQVRETAVLAGDDFLLKPVHPHDLIVSVISRAQKSQLYKEMLARDSMTDLYNQKTIKALLEKEMARASRSKTITSIAIIDIDHFKTINDSFGHTCGDTVILAIAKLLQARFRESDYVGRYGGDEFMVILPDTDASSACKIFDQLVDAVSKLDLRKEDKKVGVSISVGIADSQSTTKFSPESFINEADKALYEAKEKGRGRVCTIKTLA